MRLLKVLLTAVIAALALLVGLFTAMLVAVGGALTLLFRNFLGPRRPRPSSAPPPARRRPASSDDVIDVTATEVR